MIPGYDILDRIHNGSNSQIYRAIDQTNHRPVIIKVPDDRIPVIDRILQFRHQYEIAHQLQHPQIIETYSLEPYQNSYALVMEDAGSLSLSEWLDFANPSIVSKLQIAIDLTLALHELNQQRIIHKNINPTNILIHPVTHQVKLIDFGIASRLPTETLEILSPQILEGTLAYIAPEQTGRMNRRIDYRCDFYSLGVTLFELFTGELPFQAEDGMGWIHRHLTQIATSAHLINPNVPVVVAQIIAKLMAKNAEDRYQTAAGIKYDLSECLRQLQEIGAVTRLKIGQQDLSDKFLISQRLYGREIEVKILLDAFNRVVHGGCELMLVAGSSGIGKTAVIDRLYQPITRQKGYLIKGKFDQFNRDLPLAAFVRAFRDLIGQLLADTNFQLADWSSQILAIVGDSGQVLIDVIPELVSIIGQQPPAPKLSGIAAKNRFNWLFQKFIEIFATAKHPLVIFLDDLQWADAASLHLITLLIAGVERGNHLLLLGAYRDNEVSPIHPLMSVVGELPSKHVQTITLEPLNYNDINQLVADTLHCRIACARPLTELVIVKTQGNPFFVHQFLQALYAEEVIRFIPPTTAIDEEHWGWECDISRVQALALTDDIATLMATKLQKLPLATQSLLKWAACIGNSFELDLLSIVAEQTPHQIAMGLWSGLEAGLICPTNQTYKFFQNEADRAVIAAALEHRSSPPTSYRFLHDRVQQAAYNLISPAQKQQTHLQMGRLLLANTTGEQKEAQLFEIVNHLNLGVELIRTKAEREVVARINLQAAQKARANNADGAAFAYAQIGVQVLGTDAWQDRYQLTLALHETLAEAALISGKIDLVPRLVQVVLDRAQTTLDRITSYEILIEFHTLKKQYPQAIDRGLEILRQLGLKLAPEPNKTILSRELAKTKILLWGKSNEDLLNLPEITIPNEIAKLRILHLLKDPAFFYAPELRMLLALVGVQLTIRYGNSPWASSFYGSYCITLSSFGEPQQIEGLDRLAITLADRSRNLALMSQVRVAVAWFCQPWQTPLRAVVPMLDESLQLAIESGSLLYISWLSAAARFYSGFLLCEVAGRIQEIEGAILRSQNENSRQFLDLLRQTVLNLQVESSQPTQILGVNGGELLSQWQARNEAKILSSLYSNQTLLAYLFEDMPAALNYADAQSPYEHAAKGNCLIGQIWLFDSLTRLAVYPQSDDRLKSQLLDRVNQNQRQLFKRAQLVPENFQHKYDLVAAEQCRLFSNYAEAIELYDRSISGAKTNEYIQEEAVANELAAKFYLGWSKPKIAAVYLQEAVDVYQKWGATAKIADLQRRYSHLLERSPKSDPVSNSGISISRINSQLDNFDLASAIESTKALSNIIELPNLIDRLCEILRTNSGAEICIPILRDRQNRDFWQVCKAELVKSAETEQLKLVCIPLNQCDYLPLRMIDRVQQQGEKLILDRDAQNISRLTDEYLVRHQPQSAMCLPLINAGELQGIIYLENRHTADVFTADRQILLELIAAQVAISLHNAQLYESVSQRSAAIEAAIDGMAILSENGHFIYLNLIFAQMHGYSVEELIGQPWQSLHNPESATYVEQNICTLLAQDGQWRGEVIATRKDGSNFDKELTLFNLASGQGVIICRDITEQKQLIRSRQRQQDALTAVGNWTVMGKTGNEFYQACTKYLTQIFDVQYAFLGRLLDEDWNKCQIESCWTGTEFLSHFEMDLAGTPCLETYEHDWAIFPNAVQSRFPTATVLKVLEAESYLSVAIRDFDSKIIGHLSIIDTKTLPEDLTEFRFILQLFADRIAAELQRQADEDRLRQSKTKYQQLANNVPGVIHQMRLAPDGSLSFPYMGFGCQELFEIEPSAVMNDPSCLLAIRHPEDIPGFERAIRRSATNMTQRVSEGRALLSSGEIKWIRSISRPALQPDGAIIWDGILLDITEQKQASAERNRIAADLAISQQKYYTLIQSVNGVVWEYDLATERFTFISDRVVSLFGYPISDWLSQPNFWRDRIYPEDVAPTVRTYNDAVEYRYDCEFEYRMVTADDRVIWIYDISTIVRDDHGVPIATTGLFIDISDLKQVETDLQRTNEELQRATRLKDEFLATMSHELRTPLNAVLGMSQALQEQAFGQMNPAQLKSLSTIERNGRHLLSLINDILDISRISAGKLELDISDVSLPELCESTLISIEQQAIEKQIQLTTDIPSDLEPISIDERRIRQVLINLLNNAIKFTPAGGNVTLTVRTEIDPTGDKYALYFDIIDTGIGIDRADISKLFKPFSQIDGNLNRKYEGTGLGLSIVKHIVEVHGGTIAVESQIGVGSCFTVMIPQTIKPQLSSPTTAQFAPLILLAEDTEVTVSSFSSYLTAKGYRTIFAQTGSAAISLAQTDRPDLILIDLHLPDLDGFLAITQAPELALIPIIALTASSNQDTTAKCLAIGATESLEKPVKLRELHQTIQACLEITDSVN